MATPKTGSSKRAVYVLGGVACLVAAIVFRRWLNAEYLLLHGAGVLRFGPETQPATAAQWLELLHSDPLVGVLLLNAFDLVNYALVGVIFVGLFAALRDAAWRTMQISLSLALAGVAFFFLSNHAFALLSLSRDYFGATSDVDRVGFLSAAQALVTTSNPMVFGTGVFWALVAVSSAGLVASIGMLRTAVFPKVAGYFGLIANILGLCYFFTVAFDPPLTFIPLSGSAPFLLVWYLLMGIKLLRLARVGRNTANP